MTIKDRSDYQSLYYEDNKDRINQAKRDRRERLKAERELNKSRLKLDDWLKKQASMVVNLNLDKSEIERFCSRYEIDYRTMQDTYIKAREIGITQCEFRAFNANLVEKMKFLDYLFMNKLGNENVIIDLNDYFSAKKYN